LLPFVMKEGPPEVELLAPAGGMPALQAALDAGASAVYLGLRQLNARRGARNFTPEEFESAVKLAHERGARVYLTLNIDIAEREIGQAARIMQLARQAKADAVLVRDPVLLLLRPLFPEIEFHFSTQTCMANSADVAAAGELGADRVVLARELTLAEIAAASGAGVPTEVFDQGALCFCVSGRCLLSSWAGGGSGTRGTCTSPCRVPWSLGGMPTPPARDLGLRKQSDSAGVGMPLMALTPLSMRDLCTVDRLAELKAAGVAALKIEGRLKRAAWVAKAVGLYRRALDGEDVAKLAAEAEELGAYGGRLPTSAYLGGARSELTGTFGRAARSLSPSGAAEEQDEAEAGGYRLSITVGPKAIEFRCEYNGRELRWSTPKSVVHRQHKAISIAQLIEQLRPGTIQGVPLENATCNDDQFVLVPRAANGLVEKLSSVLRQLQKDDDELIRIDLPEAVRVAIAPRQPSPDNRLALGQKPDRVRLHASDVAAFFRQVRASGRADALPAAAIVEGLTAQSLPKAREACGAVPMIVSLPQVFFEEELAGIRDLLSECARALVSVEVNSWGGWLLARQARLRMEGGAGLPVLNSLAAQSLLDVGIECVTLSPEAERSQLESLTARCPAPCSLVVHGRPALMTTRVQLPREQFAGKTLADRRGIRLIARQERGLWVFRPVEPFDLRSVRNDRIRVAHLVVDLVAAGNPAREWLTAPLPGEKTFRFNYGRTLL
jgi:U32 family peptidase